MPVGLLPDNKVRRMVREGLGNTEIVTKLEREDRISVSPSAISHFRARNNLPAAPGRHDDLIPWRVKREHATLHAAKCLRWESRRRAGEEIPPLAERKLDAFLRRLEQEGAVVHYEPLTAEGWWIVPRREGVDTDVIRDPAVVD